jgi:hypothetical protein
VWRLLRSPSADCPVAEKPFDACLHLNISEHASDLLLQLAINPAVDKAQLDAILTAIAAQAMPPGDHFYMYGEGERLSRPVFETGPPRRLQFRRMERVIRR